MEEEEEENCLVINWLDVSPVPEAVLQLSSCRCSRKCDLPNCPCLANSLECTELCRLKTCTNQAVEDESDKENIDIEDDGSDSEFQFKIA